MSKNIDMYHNNTYIKLYRNHKMKTPEMDEFIEFHKHHIHTSIGQVSVRYDPDQFKKYSELMTSQHVMFHAVKTGNLALVKYVYNKLGTKCFEELCKVPDYSFGDLFCYAIASNTVIVKFMLSIGLNITWNSCSHENTHTKTSGLRIVERAIYKGDQTFVNYIVHELNREGIRYSLESQNPICYEIPHRQIKLSDLTGKNVYEYLFHGKIETLK